MLVERSAYDRAVTIAKTVADGTKVAAARESGRHIGPVVNKQQWEKIQVGAVVCVCVCSANVCVPVRLSFHANSQVATT